MGVGAECWACVMHVSCAVPPRCGLWCLYCCAVVSSVCLLCRLWVHALAVFNIYILREGRIHTRVLTSVPVALVKENVKGIWDLREKRQGVEKRRKGVFGKSWSSACWSNDEWRR